LAEYRNPQQEPGNERRMLMVFVVTFALIILGQFFLFKNKPAAPKANSAPTSQSAPATPDATTAAGQTTPSVSNTPAPAVAPPAGTKVASNEVETTVENDLYKIVFTNRGAQVKSWILKKYNNDQGPGHPLDLVKTIL
jgi:YidC/Oxa1 family membrane protein insertase